MVADFYAMLGADQAADRGTLEAALARCQPAWSSGTRNPKTKHTYQSYLDQIPEIRRTILGDLATRAAYDAELAASRRADRDRRLDELQRLIKLRAAKGGLTVADRSMLRDEATRLELSNDDLSRLTEPIPPKPEAPADVEAPEPIRDVLDAVVRKQIRVALDHLRRSDLYDALELPRDAPSPEVAAAADFLRRRWMQKSQVTAEKTAWLEVVSHAQSHLGTPQGRAKYDRTLAMEAELKLAESIAFAIKGLARLDYGTRVALVEEATARGITPERADVLISRGCKAQNVARDAAPALFLTSVEPPRFLRCRSCSGLTDHEDVATPPARAECRHCRAPLQWTCPNCRRVRWMDEPKCPCGFPLEHVEPLVRHFEAAQVAHRSRYYPLAIEHLRKVQQYSPKHAGARKGIETVRKLMAELDAARHAFEAAKGRRHLVAARDAVMAWAGHAPVGSPEVVAATDEIERALRMARGFADRARALETDDPKAARGLYEKALAIAADLDEARDGVLRCPPDPPSNLAIEVDSGKVRLRWIPPAPDGLGSVRFRIVRKRQGVPGQPNDGATVVETDQAEAEDTGVGAGESVGYAVFTARGPACSTLAATAGPIDVLPEVGNLRAEVGHGEVALTWVLPSGASGVKVVRNARRRPIHDRDGQAVEALPGGVVDRSLEDDRTYHYAVYALYPGPDGFDRPSKGVAIAAVPHPPVEAVGTPSLSIGHDGRVQLAWVPPSRGTVRLLRTLRPLPEEPGSRVPTSTAASWDGDWLTSTADGVAEDHSPPSLGVCFYTPILAWAGAAIVGHPARYSCVADPTDLRAVRVGGGGRVQLRWRWSPRGTESRVVAKAGSPPTSSDEPDAIVANVSDDEYSRLGHFTITLPTLPAGPWHLAVFSLAVIQGEEVVSPGLEPSARTVVPGPNPEVTVSYTLRRPNFPGRPWSVTFRTEPEASAIPPTALVAHPRTVPLSPDDGEIIARFPASQDGGTFPIPPGLDLAHHRTRIFADPATEPDTQPPIRLRHPENGTSRA